MKKLVIVLLISHLLAGMAWACEGWVLLSPQLTKIGTVRPGVPYSMWLLEESFDTAKECKAFKAKEVRESQARLNRVIDRGLNTEFDGRNYRGWVSSVCVPAFVFYGKGE